MQDKSKIFISYSHKDKSWLNRLKVHLKPLEREGLIDAWDDTELIGGEYWEKEITEALEAASVAILLISADFLASDFIAEKELPPLLAAAKKKGVVILPVIVKPSRFRKTRLSQFQSVNSPEEPLIDMTEGESEATFVRLTEVIEKKVLILKKDDEIEAVQGKDDAHDVADPTESDESQPKARGRKWIPSVNVLVVAFILVSVVQFGLYESKVNSIDELTAGGIRDELSAIGIVLFVVTLGSPFMFIGLIRGGISLADVPLLISSLLNSAILILLLRTLFIKVLRFFRV